MPPQQALRYLLVEGNSDRQVIENLCDRHRLAKPDIKMPARGGGIDQLLESVPDRINEPGLEVLGIVIDADVNVAARWQALCDRLQNHEKRQEMSYAAIPPVASIGGWISFEPERPRVGIWLVPDNHGTGSDRDTPLPTI
jgi:hypothetical protein